MIKIYKEADRVISIEIVGTNNKGGVLLQPDFSHGEILLTVSEPKTKDVAEVRINLSDLLEVVKDLQQHNG
jgi:hypothetical protein